MVQLVSRLWVNLILSALGSGIDEEVREQQTFVRNILLVTLMLKVFRMGAWVME